MKSTSRVEATDQTQQTIQRTEAGSDAAVVRHSLSDQGSDWSQASVAAREGRPQRLRGRAVGDLPMMIPASFVLTSARRDNTVDGSSACGASAAAAVAVTSGMGTELFLGDTASISASAGRMDAWATGNCTVVGGGHNE